MRKMQTSALRRKLAAATGPAETPAAKRARDALDTADAVIDRANTGSASWREAAENVIAARAAVADAVAAVATAQAVRRRSGSRETRPPLGRQR